MAVADLRYKGQQEPLHTTRAEAAITCHRFREDMACLPEWAPPRFM
jgi:hypothetical protein